MALIILEVGRRFEIAAGAQRQFPDETEVEIVSDRGEHIDVRAQAQFLARTFLQKLDALKSRTAEPIKVVLSGPVALCFILGMMIGINDHSLEVYQFDAPTSRYVSLGAPNRDWLG